jgi:hypothetical protein
VDELLLQWIYADERGGELFSPRSAETRRKMEMPEELWPSDYGDVGDHGNPGDFRVTPLFLRRATMGFVENQSDIYSSCGSFRRNRSLTTQGCFAQHMVPIYSVLNAILMRNIQTHHLILEEF